MSRHYQFESNLSLTGSNADYRFSINPLEEDILVLCLYNFIAKKAGFSFFDLEINKVSHLDAISKLASEL